jgi:hypothetical protein
VDFRFLLQHWVVVSQINRLPLASFRASRCEMIMKVGKQVCEGEPRQCTDFQKLLTIC